VRYVINPGSVGQPRDGDPRAAFAIYDPEGPSLALRRIPYAVDAAQRRILGAGLPASLANRLAVGR
jgi:diadenosine tetraphosphatase ApaH/serine/threonine PP2A family protein phosphatase